MSTIVGCIAGVSPVIDGVFVEVIDDDDGPPASDDRPRDRKIFPMLFEVTRYGGMPVERGTMYINFANITPLRESPTVDDLGESNPYGAFIYTTQWSDETGRLSISEFERCIHLNLRHADHVEDIVLWRSHLGGDWDMKKVVRLYQDEGKEVIDLVFIVRELADMGRKNS